MEIQIHRRRADNQRIFKLGPNLFPNLDATVSEKHWPELIVEIP